MHSRAGKINCARAAWTAGEPLEAMADETARSSSIIFWRGRARSPCAVAAQRGWPRRRVVARGARFGHASLASSTTRRARRRALRGTVTASKTILLRARVYLAIRAFSGVITCGAARRRPAAVRNQSSGAFAPSQSRSFDDFRRRFFDARPVPRTLLTSLFAGAPAMGRAKPPTSSRPRAAAHQQSSSRPWARTRGRG